MKALKELQEIEKDCFKLKKKNDLTEFGKGELHVIEIVRKLKIETLVMIIYKTVRDKKLNKTEKRVIEKIVESIDYIS